VEKLQCICNYFHRVCKDMPTGVLALQRRYINPKNLPKWKICDLKFSSMKLHVSLALKIETHGDGMLQVDFANKFVGEGVLGHGCVQEEIRFIICPELIVSRLFTEALKPQEALLMYGAEQFNSYSGYAQSFEWAGDFEYQ
jgi:poly(ADP-ribose) glycohydrolase